MKDFLKTSEVARMYGVCDATIRAWHKKGILKAQRVGKRGPLYFPIALLPKEGSELGLAARTMN